MTGEREETFWLVWTGHQALSSPPCRACVDVDGSEYNFKM